MKTARTRLIHPTQPNAIAMRLPAVACEIAQNTPLINRLIAGPAAEIRNWSPGFLSSFVAVAPPKKYNVMLETSTLRRRATNACESSCPRIDPKKSTAVNTASGRAFDCGIP